MLEKVVLDEEILESDIEKNKIFSILAYLGLMFVIPAVAAKDSRFALFHANQGLCLFLLEIVVGILVKILTFLPKFAILFGLSGGLSCLILMGWGIFNVLRGVTAPLPLIGFFQILPKEQ